MAARPFIDEEGMNELGFHWELENNQNENNQNENNQNENNQNENNQNKNNQNKNNKTPKPNLSGFNANSGANKGGKRKHRRTAKKHLKRGKTMRKRKY